MSENFDFNALRQSPEKTTEVLIALLNVRIQQLNQALHESELNAEEGWDACDKYGNDRFLALSFFEKADAELRDVFLKFCEKNGEPDVVNRIKEFLTTQI